MTPSPYTWMTTMLIAAMGKPLRHFTVPGEPQGFSVARKRCKRTLAIAHWSGSVRKIVDHHYRSKVVWATIEKPVYVHVAPYFSSRLHCDPENVRKLLVDALYLDAGAGTGQDKYVFGSHAGPAYDVMNPRTEVWLWRVDGQAPPKISKTAREEARREKVRKEREADAAETVRHRAKREKIRHSNPFGIEV